jgi:hypothetical protein
MLEKRRFIIIKVLPTESFPSHSPVDPPAGALSLVLLFSISGARRLIQISSSSKHSAEKGA